MRVLGPGEVWDSVGRTSSKESGERRVEIESGGWKTGSRDQRLLHFAARQLTPGFLLLGHSLLQKKMTSSALCDLR